MIQSELEAMDLALHGNPDAFNGRPHKYVGGPPPKRIKQMQLGHEVRARRYGVPWDMVDLRKVYAHHKGVCGICYQPVSFDEFAIDHIKPLSRGGPHVFENLQPAHKSCNSRKGSR
jgi:5-methylcytosine-specific restriction endonuclease McrA